jgi:hypothetical protein
MATAFEELFIRLLPVFDDVERPDAYLYAGIANAARSWHRSEGRRRGREEHRDRRGGPVDELLGSLRPVDCADCGGDSSF